MNNWGIFTTYGTQSNVSLFYKNKYFTLIYPILSVINIDDAINTKKYLENN